MPWKPINEYPEVDGAGPLVLVRDYNDVVYLAAMENSAWLPSPRLGILYHGAQPIWANLSGIVEFTEIPE